MTVATSSMVDKHIQSCVHRQRWSGVSVIDEEGAMKVVTSRIFQKGEVVCDFHGQIVSVDEGLNKLKELHKKEMNHLLFFYK